MAAHLTEEEIWTDVEEGLGDKAKGHLAECAACRERRREVEEGLAFAAEAGAVPEPAPLYWQAFRRQVERSIAEEPEASFWSGWRRFLSPAALLPAAAMVVAVLALVPALRTGAGPEPNAPTLGAWEALPSAAQEEDSLDVLRGAALAGTDLEAASGCTELADCLATLTDEESRALADVLRERLPEGRS